MTFTGSGELDNGTTFTLSLTNTDQSAYSAGNLAITTPGFGKFTIDQGAGGSGMDRYDDMMPTAWEETTGTALGTGLQTVGGISGSPNIDWDLNSDMLPDGIKLALAYTPRATGALGPNDKAASGSKTEQAGSGYDIAAEYGGVEGLKIFGGWSTIENNALNGADQEQMVAGATYAVGGITVGYQYSLDEKNGISTSVNFYENTAYGVSFAVNDDLTLSYGEHESDKSVETGVTADITTTAKSLQLSYSMGGASIKIAQSSVKNQNYVTGATQDKDGTTIALTLAF